VAQLSHSEIVKALAGFICSSDNGWQVDSSSLDVEGNLIEDGIIDSLGLFSVIGFIEEAFDFTVANEDVVTENFGSIASMARYVLRNVTME